MFKGENMSKARLQLTWYNKDKALIPSEKGKYGYMWVSPSDPRYCETHTLIYDEYIEGIRSPKESKYVYSEVADLEPQKDNLMILGESGDVLEALTRVPELSEKYSGQIKLIYIDPPFNTAKAFSSYEDNLEHSIWLTMMRDRLINMKKLLSQDGTIWVHLNDIEVHRMRLLLDEVFGSNNFIAEISWEKTFKPRNDAKMISGRHDVILCYKRSNLCSLNKLPRTADMDSAYSNPDNDVRGRWTSAPSTAPGAKTHQGMVYGIQHPITGQMIYPPIGQCWRLGQDQMLSVMRDWNKTYQLKNLEDEQKRAEICDINTDDVRKDVAALVIPEFSPQEGEKRYKEGEWPLIYITSNGKGGFRKKTYLSDMEDRAIEDLWFQDEVGSNDEAKNEIKALFPGEAPFDTPKPERLLERIIHIATNPGDIVFDCFAGSGTTAAVAQKMGRRWVTCELVNSNFDRYILPRLKKVVNNEDPGGITQKKKERIVAQGVELPDGITPDDASKFTSILNKVIAENDELKKSKEIKEIKARTKTVFSKEYINWRGGGGFQVAHLSPSCFDYNSELDCVVLTEDAVEETLVKAVAANLGFYLLNDGSVFDGYRGNSYLKVIYGVVTKEAIDWIASYIDDDQTIVIAATSVMDGTREYLRKKCNGSRIIVIPDDVFHFSKGGTE